MRILDPWFQALEPETYTIGSGTTGKVYGSSYNDPVSILGCAEQHQVCRAGGGDAGDCTSLTGSGPVLLEALELPGFNNRQQATLFRGISALGHSTLTGALSLLGTSSMLANAVVSSDGTPGLPDDQWVKELSHWFGE